MSAPSIGLSPEDLFQLFPFHLVFGRDLCILQSGPGWQKINVDAAPGVPVHHLLRCLRPISGWDFNGFRNSARAVFVLQAVRLPLKLRGGMRYLPAQDALLFLGSPWVTQLSEIKPLNLDLNLFPAHDALPDLLFLLQAQKASLDELTLLTGELTEANNAAEQALRVKDEFIANISHELRTPLNGILGMAELALGTALDSEQTYYLETARSSAALLGTIIGDILDFSQLQAGELQLARTVFNVRQLFRDALQPFAVAAAGKAIELLCDIEPGVPALAQGDPSRLLQIVANLVGNAIKFTPHGEVCVNVSHLSESGSHWTLNVQVSDTGIGIAPDRLDTIFRPFTQVDGSNTRKYGGTGLGLSLSRRLAQAMGGTIQAHSNCGQGSRFRFSAQLQSVPPASAADFPDRELHGLPVLVVAASTAHRALLSRWLRRWQMRPTVVPDLAAAICALQTASHPFRFVLLDLPSAEAGEPSFCELLRHLPGTPPSLVLLSAPLPSAAKSPARDAWGAAAHLCKPVDEHQLAESLLRLLPAAPPRTPANSPAGQLTPLRILVAEDNPVNQQLVFRLLQKQGHHVRLVENGRQAVDAWQEQPFDAVLMDLQMPAMGGCEATREIRRREQPGQHIPILAVTANVSNDAREECLRAGMNGYVPKPVKAADLWSELGRVRQALVDSSPPHSSPW